MGGRGQELVWPFHGTLKSNVPQEWMDEMSWLHADRDLGKLKVTVIIIGGHGQKWAWPLKLWDSKISCISQMIWWIEPID